MMFDDLNVPVTASENPISYHPSHDLYDGLLESSLSQHVSKPTRDDNILDLVFSTNDVLKCNLSVGPELRASDQENVTLDINL